MEAPHFDTLQYLKYILPLRQNSKNVQKEDLLKIYTQDPRLKDFKKYIAPGAESRKLAMKGLVGSSRSIVCKALTEDFSENQLFILRDKEQAAYFYNDLEKLSGFTIEQTLEPKQDYKSSFSSLNTAKETDKKILYFPASYKHPYQTENTDNANVLSRMEVLNRLRSDKKDGWIVVTYPEALAEKVITTRFLESNTVDIHVKESISQDFLTDFFEEYNFERVDFVAEPGQYALRGGIVDVFSFSGDTPYRIEFNGEEVESIRGFEVGTQLSISKYDKVTLLPNVQMRAQQKERVGLLSYFSAYSIIWAEDMQCNFDSLKASFEKATQAYKQLDTLIPRTRPEELYSTPEELEKGMNLHTVVEFGMKFYYKHHASIEFQMRAQPIFNKKFDLLAEHILEGADRGYDQLILSENPKQIQRLERVFFELSQGGRAVRFIPLSLSLNEGFIDDDLKIACFTDHQIFERYHHYTVQPKKQDSQALTLKELYSLKPGDYISHIDHGIGRFAGLEKIEVNGREQEAICLLYKDNDMLRLSIHALHKMSRYSGKEGVAPTLNRLGSNAWAVLKSKAKQKVKDIAKELIKLYAERKSSKGFAFSADSYLQQELESSFFYEDTPDQLKASSDVKKDMESSEPMDRLVCGDVGFGKTEVAIRAAFKAVCDGKQVAVLVPTTILAYQHYKTFTERLGNLPCRVDYLNRFRSNKEKKEVLKALSEGRIDILIGTHRILSKDVIFKDLGLLVVDEEQKFGVAMKEKLKKFKVNIDTLTLTATPIPRTLQFSLMGARDLSIIQTPPPNRYPVSTEVRPFNEELIRDVVLHELSRGGQVFFVHHRVQNIMEMAGMLQRLIPDAKIGVAHGQMEGDKLEEILLGFMEGEYDILVSTKIVENGLDIPNANTIIVNEAHQYGLSELHQLRGRVGRSNKKAFCYMLAPPPHLLSAESKRRLRAIEEFSDIGSGFQVAMRDLDIRGSGNILGGEQSGFISEIGFEMYQRILDEAIRELKNDPEGGDSVLKTKEKNSDMEHSSKGSCKESNFSASDCLVETDLEILIPDRYVSNITERLSLYKELDSLEKEADLEAFQLRLQDRFGPVPEPTIALIQTIALRREAKILGLDKLILKNNTLTAFFAAQDESLYYQSAIFTCILAYVQDHSKSCSLKENKHKLSVVFSPIYNVKEAINLCQTLALQAL